MVQSTKSARVIRIHEAGEPNVLKIETLDIPAPAAQEVRIAPRALGLNRADAMYRRAEYIEDPVFPSLLGYEASGVVDAVGSDVTHVKVGDNVSVIPAFSLNQYGTHGELILVPAYSVVKHPETLNHEEAASFWSVYLTAYGMIVDTAKILSGQFIVINAASSGVGLAAIQIANVAGAIPIAITTSESKREALEQDGAKHVIVIGKHDVTDEIMRITKNEGANVLLDAVGGPLLAQIIPAMTFRGKIFIYGTLSPDQTVLPAMEILSKALTISGFMVRDINSDPVRLKAAKDFLYNGIATGALKPTIAKTFDFDDFKAAHEFLESNQQVGKVVVTIK